MGRKAHSFARSGALFKAQAKVLVLCEDTKSSLIYLTDAKQHFRAYADVDISHSGRTDPLGIVEAAIKRRKSYDDVYCVIDRDSHPSFDAALAAARTGDVHVIASYPCYEYWLLLHFRPTRAPYQASGGMSAADHVARVLREEPGMEGYAKGTSRGLFASLVTRLPQARQRAAVSLAEALAVSEMNPSTRLHELISLFESLGTPGPAAA